MRRSNNQNHVFCGFSVMTSRVGDTFFAPRHYGKSAMSGVFLLTAPILRFRKPDNFLSLVCLMNSIMLKLKKKAEVMIWRGEGVFTLCGCVTVGRLYVQTNTKSICGVRIYYVKVRRHSKALRLEVKDTQKP